MAGIAVAVVALAGLWGCDSPLPSPAEQARLRGAAPVPRVEFYVHAHPDDWQLFMGDRTNASLHNGETVVLIYASAGDAGKDSSYWRAREAGSLASVDAITPPGPWACGAQSVNAHPIWRCAKSSARVIAYYLRMPDGNGSTGTGFATGSLSVLRDRGTPTRPVDGSTTYGSWPDFYTTLGSIVDLEAAAFGSAAVEVHAPEHDRRINPGDHPDHYATAEAVRAAAATRRWNRTLYVGYETRKKRVNLSERAHAIKDAEFLAYDDVVAGAGYETYRGHRWYDAWRWRTYFRRVAAPASTPAPVAPTGRTGPAPAARQAAAVRR